MAIYNKNHEKIMVSGKCNRNYGNLGRLGKSRRGSIFISVGIFALFFNKISTPAHKVLDNSEESNIIPLSAIPNVHGNSASNRQPQPDNANDLSLTVLNLQKDAKNKQNF